MGLLIEVKEKSVGIQFCMFIFMYKDCSKDSKKLHGRNGISILNQMYIPI